MADGSLRGRVFGAALSDAVDAALVEAFADADVEAAGEVAVVGLGSYARRELCPASDIDVLLVHNLRGRHGAETVRSMTEQLWYPLWDAGFVTGHGARTIKESIALSDDDLDALTALLDVRIIAGSQDLGEALERKARELAARRHARVLPLLADGVDLRRQRPGVIAEMLEPDLKEGAGGLRDVQSLEWGGWALGAPGGVATLIARDYLTPADLIRVEAGRELLLDLRVALQRTTNSRSDRLPLQEHDGVAARLGFADADALVHDLARATREIAWIAADVWSRVRDMLDGPKAKSRQDQPIANGVWLRDGRVHIDTDADGSIPALRTLEAACASAEYDVRFDRTSLTRLQATGEPTWDVWQRAAFVRLLRSGADAVPVFEALDHEGVLTRLLPEWEHVRSLPQRNAYHRYTVDRHLLEAVAQSARLLDAGDAGFEPGREVDVEAIVARACRRPELLLLGALLHDIAKGTAGDHSEVGEATAEGVVRRMGFDSEAREIVPWLVRNHLLMAEVATRRDLSDATVADNVAAACAGDAERLRLLYLLTIGDSKATGPAAWNPSKAALVRDLFVKAATAIERGEAKAVANDRRIALGERMGEENARMFLARLPESYVLAFDVDTMCVHESLLRDSPTVRCEPTDAGHVAVTVVARDRPGLLVTLAGALTVCGLDVLEASLFGTSDGFALDVFRGADPFGRVADDDGLRVAQTIERALAGDLDLPVKVDARRRAYAKISAAAFNEVHVDVSSDESETDTVVEVHADDDIGLLYRLASAFTELELDVRIAKVATLGKRVVDVFYVRDADAHKIDDPDAVARLRATLVDRMTR
ncbi:MAG: [protein-PII] uridylyltransferase [Actinomycetota bacterium]|nr:[protein-PII] uridylyltransferase [Actinomycetota bacterium]